MNKVKQVTLADRIRAAIESFKAGKPKHTFQLGIKVVRCDECERGDCEACAYKQEFEALVALPDCNTCADVKDCVYAPQIGEPVRNNCPLHRPIKKETDK